jgi:16S rRNA (guanine966-N2)-methyltransferase
LGGRRLVAPAGAATRPTTDRVRESLFSILSGMGVLDGARVVDLYAGTGALGIEAISRGAAHATFVESGRPALAALKENVRTLEVEGSATVIAGRVEKLKVASPFDLVLVDPPWVDLGAAVDAVARLVASGGVAAGATIVIEHASRDASPVVAGVEQVDARVYGDTSIWIGRIASASDRAEDVDG